jgi:Tol biopolymer transport system component
VGGPGAYRNPRLSPDGTRVAVQRFDSATSSTDLWVIDLVRNVPAKFTFAQPGEFNAAPIWSPDGMRIAWQTGRGQTVGGAVFQKLSSGASKDEKIRDLPAGSIIDEWVHGIGLLFHDGSPGSSKAALQVFPMEGGERRVVGEAQSLTHARVSPDGRWIAFTSTDTGRPEVYVQNFPTPAERIPISVGGGDQPVWRRDGRELFFLSTDGKLMAVPVDLSERATVGAPVTLFSAPIDGAGQAFAGHQYDVAQDGQRFLVNARAKPQASPQTVSPITIVVNWTAGLEK